MVEVGCLILDIVSEQIGSAKLIFMDTEGEELRILHGTKNFIQDFEPTIVLEASSKLLSRSGAASLSFTMK
jgi:hypothetical protein